MLRLHSVGTLRILDFDIENRPLSYLGQDFTTAEVTAIAASWVGEETVRVWLLGRHRADRMLAGFVRLYNQADIVTGHNIRRHDLPILVGALLEAGLPHLRPKLTQDTYGDLIKRSGISASQESLAGMYGLSDGKEHMSQVDWRAANRLTKDGIERARTRVEKDVRQHKALREKLLEVRALKAPRVWAP